MLELLSDTYAICRLDKNASAPDWATRCPFSSVTRTPYELSVVCPDAVVPADVQKESGWRVLMVEGPLDLALTGVMASLTGPLARAGIAVFTLSTYDTDYLLVKHERLDGAMRALTAEGWNVVDSRSVPPRRNVAWGVEAE